MSLVGEDTAYLGVRDGVSHPEVRRIPENDPAP